MFPTNKAERDSKYEQAKGDVKGIPGCGSLINGFINLWPAYGMLVCPTENWEQEGATRRDGEV